MAGVAKEKVQHDNKFCKKHNTTEELAKFDVHVRMANPTRLYNSNKLQASALAIFVRGPYAKLSGELMEDVTEMIGNKNKIKFVPLSLKYNQTIKDNFCVRGLTEEVLRVEISRKTVCENIL
eukprot:13124713-Ditylum_brightwellii.AAC.1